MLLGQEAVGRLPLDESMVTNTMLFQPKFCFCFFEKLYMYQFVFLTIRFCYQIKIFNYFKGAKHKATESFLHCLLNEPLSKINLFFFVSSHYLIAKHYRSYNYSCFVYDRCIYLALNSSFVIRCSTTDSKKIYVAVARILQQVFLIFLFLLFQSAQ